MTPKTQARLQCAVYSLVGASSATSLLPFALYDPTYLLFALCGMVMIWGGILSIGRMRAGRLVAGIGIVGLSPLFYWALISMVPEHSVIFQPVGPICVLFYLALVAFFFFFPRPFPFSVLAFVFVLFSTAVAYGLNYRARLLAGEYDRPSLECFLWKAEPNDDLVIVNHPEGLREDEQLKSLLIRASVRGTVEAEGRADKAPQGKRLIILAQSKPPADSKLFLPKTGILLYAYDGSEWRKFPADAPTYPLYASFREDGENSMICRTRPDRKRTCFACFLSK